jgi:acid phosphatase
MGRVIEEVRRMRRRTLLGSGALLSTAALVVATATSVTGATAATGSAAAAHPKALGGFKHIVVIYEENHSFDNLYGSWGKVGKHHVNGRSHAGAAHTTQLEQNGTPYPCLPQLDVNLTVGPLKASCGASTTVTFGDGTSTTYASHFKNKPFMIDTYIAPTDTTCPNRDSLFSFPNGVSKTAKDANGNPVGLPGGCTRDLVHKFYQEIYQTNGGRQNRYVTGSDSAGLPMGYYATKQLPIYKYLHGKHAPHYVIADHFFQGAHGGSYLNHQYLIAAQPILWSTAPVSEHSILDTQGMVRNNYPFYKTKDVAKDGTVTQQCGLPTTRAGYACGDWSVNTSLPAMQPTASYGPKIPLVDDTTQDLTIGDRMTDAGVSWAWYSGGWDNAAGITNGKGYTNGAGPTCSDPNSAPAGPDINGQNAGYPYCPDKTFQQHHQPFAYYARYAPGTPGRAAHLKDEADFLAQAKAGTLPKVSFVKPLGNENEHPGYASEATGSDHLVDLIKAIRKGPQGKKTLIVVTYDEFGGQWDHMSPPGQGRAGAHDVFGPGTRVPALIVSPGLTTNSVDHSVYDTTSIMRTIEKRFGLSPVDHPDGVIPRDREVDPLTHMIRLGEGKA